MQFLSVLGPVGCMKGKKYKEFLHWIRTELNLFIIYYPIQCSQKPYEILWHLSEKFPGNCV